ncbi:MAG: BrnT family toxin [Chloroflexi bacterium]|nr:BrnT family toxin [Chloroflexota bacterium]
MEIEYNSAKRQKTLIHRQLDFERCREVFSGPVLEMEDTRFDYGELRFITFGLLDVRMVVIVWTPRGNKRRIISMRKANEREKKRFRQYLG